MNKALALLTQPSTYVGIAGVIISYFSLEAMSAEQLAGVVASLAGIFISEQK